MKIFNMNLKTPSKVVNGEEQTTALLKRSFLLTRKDHKFQFSPSQKILLQGKIHFKILLHPYRLDQKI